MTKILEGVIDKGTGSPYAAISCSAAAGKTGTSEEESDAWFVGYTPLLSTAVWVGHPKSREYTGYGGPTAGPIWSDFMDAALEGECPEFEAPSSLPELSPYNEGHTASSGYSRRYPGDERYESESGEEEFEEGYEGEEEFEEEGEEGLDEPSEEGAPPVEAKGGVTAG